MTNLFENIDATAYDVTTIEAETWRFEYINLLLRATRIPALLWLSKYEIEIMSDEEKLELIYDYIQSGWCR